MSLVLDPGLYRRAADDDETWVPALRVLGFSAAVVGASWALSSGPVAGVGATLALVAGWMVVTGATHLLATRAHSTAANVEALGRAFAFALAPMALLPLGLLPPLQTIVAFVAFAWVLVALLVAARRVLALTITEAFETVVPGWVFLWVMPLATLGLVA